jgi:hypothetical protein
MHSALLDRGPAAERPATEPGRFYMHLANGLHAIAQPLTILRSSVAAFGRTDITPDRHRRYLDISTQQVERACVLFESLQDLVVAHQAEPDLHPVDLKDLVVRTLEEQRPALQAAGASVTLAAGTGLPPGLPPALPLVLADAARTRQALTISLQIAAVTSSPGESLQIQLRARGQWVECVLEGARPHGRELNSSEHLSLALAETDILSQRGEYRFVVDPFCVFWALPVYSVSQ